MIRSVTIDNLMGKQLECVLADPWAHGLNITDVQGITPEGINVVTQDLALLDGSAYSSSRAPERDITINFRYAPGDGDIEHARHNMYELFSLGRFVRLYFNTDENFLWIDGIVKDISADIFSNAETASVDITCPDPWFRSSSVEKVVRFTHINEGNAFEFPFSIGHDPEERVQFGEYDGRWTFKTSNVFRIFNPGDRDIGCVIRAMRTSIGDDPIEIQHIAFRNITLNETSIAMLNYDGTTSTDKDEHLDFNWGDVYEMNSIPGYKMINFYKLELNEQYKTDLAELYAKYADIPYPMDNHSEWDSMSQDEQIKAIAEWKPKYQEWFEEFNERLRPDGTLVLDEATEDDETEKYIPKIPPNLYTVTKHLNMFDRGHDWIHLRRGWNEIDVTLRSGPIGATQNEVPNFEITIEFDPLYEGV